MKKAFLLFIVTLSVLTSNAYNIDYKTSDSIFVVNLLNKAQKQSPNTNYILFLPGSFAVYRTLHIHWK